MTEGQYRRALLNRAARPLAALLETPAERELLTAAARSLRQRERAARALAEIISPWCGNGYSIAGLEGGTLTVVAQRLEVWAALCRRAAELERELGRRVPGVRRLDVRLVAGAGPVQGGAAADGE